jgi:hypothetical protein
MTSNSMDEPYCITNPMPKLYKFLFRIQLDEETQEMALAFVTNWLEERGRTIKRQKLVNMPLSGMFQVKVWLN